MNCIKCGSKNIDENLKCLDCGHDNHKGSHIDIEDYKPQNKGHNFEKARKIVLAIFIFVFITIISFGTTLFIYYLKDKSNAKLINEYNNLKDNSNVFVLYMGSDSKYDDLLNLYKGYYEYNYLNINNSKLTSKNTKKFKSELNLDKLDNSIIVYKKGELTLAKNFDNKNSLLNNLKEQKVIPNMIENPESEKKLFNDTLATQDAVLIYISFVNNDLVKDTGNVLNDLCDNYKIKYQFIRGYVFSEQQILNYLSQYGYSSMKNGLIITLEEGKIKKVVDLDGLYFDDYVEIFQNYDIINSMSDQLKYVDINAFDELIKENQKYIFVFGNEKCKYCDNVKYTLGSIVKEYNIDIYYVNLENEFNITDKLKEFDYKGTNTYPLTIVIENRKILDYVIGSSEKKYYIDLFTKDGIIR